MFSDLCEKTVLKRLLKELWRITLTMVEKTVVLPAITDLRQVIYSDLNAKIIKLVYSSLSSQSRAPRVLKPLESRAPRLESLGLLLPRSGA